MFQGLNILNWEDCTKYTVKIMVKVKDVRKEDKVKELICQVCLVQKSTIPLSNYKKAK